MNRLKIISLITILVILLAALGVRSLSTKAASTKTIPNLSCSWQVVPSPIEFNGGGSFNGVAAFSSNDVWAVGYGSEALTEHYDGTGWSVIPNLVTNGYLNAVTTIPGTSQAWSVGFYSDSSSNRILPLIEQWNGSAWWNIVSSPDTGSAASGLDGVTALSGSDVWAVGSSSITNSNNASPLIEQWNGTSWNIVKAPGEGVLYGVTAVAANDVWAVGVNEKPQAYGDPLIEHYDGTGWSIITSPVVQGNLLSVAQIPGTNQLWAVGNSNCTTLIEQWNGTSWSVVPSPSNDRIDELAGVVALSATNAWAVGFHHFTKETLFEHWDGTSWRNAYISTPGSLKAITSVPGTKQLWTVGTGGLGTYTEYHC